MRYRIRVASLALGAAVAAFGGDRIPRVGLYAREAIEKDMRAWSKGAVHRDIGNRPKAFAKEKGVLPLPRGIWMHGESHLGRPAGPNGKPDGKTGNHMDAYRIFRQDLHSLEISRSDDGALQDYQGVLREAAQAARTNQHINYVPIIISSLQYGVLDSRNQPSGNKDIYFRAVPHKASQFSQLITFGLEPGFVLNNLGKDLVSLDISAGGKSYSLAMESAVPVAFEDPGIYPVSVQAHFQDGSVLSTNFDFEIKRLHDGTYANSRMDSDGTIKFKM
jgi:hypothetical protein